MTKKTLTCAEAGKKGGKSCLNIHGPEFYSEIGRKGGLVKKKKLVAEV